MFSSQIRWFLYGVLITTSLVSIITYASGTDGVFGDYFERIVANVGTCTNSDVVVTGFSNAPYGTKLCRTIKDLMSSAGIWSDASGNIGIGTNTPTATLSVSGSFRLTDGTQGNGKVLTSDASGNASWEVASGGGGGWIWESVPLTDTNDFDVQCNYIFTAGGITHRATFITNGVIWEVISLFDANTTANWIGIKKGSKAVLETHQDNWSNNMIYANTAVTSIKKNCSGWSSFGWWDLQFGWTYLWRWGYGAIIPGCEVPNTITNDCSCPAGYTARQSSKGGYYYWSEWDAYYWGYTCEKNWWSSTNWWLGYSQTWQDMTASRVLWTTYTNTTGKPISIQIIWGAPVNWASNATLIVDGIEIDYYTTNAYNGTLRWIISPWSTYRVIGSNWSFNLWSPYGWKELR